MIQSISATPTRNNQILKYTSHMSSKPDIMISTSSTKKICRKWKEKWKAKIKLHKVPIPLIHLGINWKNKDLLPHRNSSIRSQHPWDSMHKNLEMKKNLQNSIKNNKINSYSKLFLEIPLIRTTKAEADTSINLTSLLAQSATAVALTPFTWPTLFPTSTKTSWDNPATWPEYQARPQLATK